MRTAALAVLVALVTVYMIILPASALTKDHAAEMGGVGVDAVEAEAEEGSTDEAGAAEDGDVGHENAEADSEKSGADTVMDADVDETGDADVPDAEDAEESGEGREESGVG